MHESVASLEAFAHRAFEKSIISKVYEVYIACMNYDIVGCEDIKTGIQYLQKKILPRVT